MEIVLMVSNRIPWDKQKELSDIIEVLFKALWQQVDKYEKDKVAVLVVALMQTKIDHFETLMTSLNVPEDLRSIFQELHAIAVMYPDYVVSKYLNHIAGQSINQTSFSLKDLRHLELEQVDCLQDKEYVGLLINTQIELLMQNCDFSKAGKYKLLELVLNSTTKEFYRILDKVWGKLNRHSILFVQTLQQLHQQSLKSQNVNDALRRYLAASDVQEEVANMTINDALQLFYVPHTGWRFHPAVHLAITEKLEVLALFYKESKTQTMTIETLKQEYEYLSKNNHYFISMVMQAEKYLNSELSKNQNDNIVIEDIYQLLKGLDSLGAYYAVALALSHILCETGMEVSAALLAGYGIACSALDKRKTHRQTLSFNNSHVEKEPSSRKEDKKDLARKKKLTIKKSKD